MQWDCLQVGEEQALGKALRTARNMACPIYILFPSPDAADLAEVVEASRLAAGVTKSMEGSKERGCNAETWSYLLIAIDGTWRQAKEMYKVR